MNGNTASPFLAALLNFLCPGLGYLKSGRPLRAAAAGATVLAFLLLGFSLGGRLFSIFDRSEGLLTLVFALCDMGTGAVYFALAALGVAAGDQSFRATSEYGNVFLMTAGLVNYLHALDAYDLEAGRGR
ncbi:MAG TPA: DUF6677 family protein [Pyrinomonadaceae bacterium]|nr:DUF6677 family protein [Pyrinomonadaceae bacterium]